MPHRRSLLLAFLVLVLTAVGRTASMGLTAVLLGIDLEATDPALRRDGLLLGVGLWGGAGVGALALWMVSRADRRGLLALTRPGTPTWIRWTVVLLLQVLCFDLLAHGLDRPLVPLEWRQLYQTAPPLLLPLGLVAVSIFEELFLRGFLQGRLTETKLGSLGAVGVTALLFSLLHFPEDGFRFFDVFTTGLLLGLARRATGSSLTGIPAHVLGNLKVVVMLELLG